MANKIDEQVRQMAFSCLERARNHYCGKNRPLMESSGGHPCWKNENPIDGDEFRQIVSRYTEISRKVSGEDQLIPSPALLRKGCFSLSRLFQSGVPWCCRGASIFWRSYFIALPPHQSLAFPPLAPIGSVGSEQRYNPLYREPQ